jgi:hypothetical protein
MRVEYEKDIFDNIGMKMTKTGNVDGDSSMLNDTKDVVKANNVQHL